MLNHIRRRRTDIFEEEKTSWRDRELSIYPIRLPGKINRSTNGHCLEWPLWTRLSLCIHCQSSRVINKGQEEGTTAVRCRHQWIDIDLLITFCVDGFGLNDVFSRWLKFRLRLEVSHRSRRWSWIWSDKSPIDKKVGWWASLNSTNRKMSFFWNESNSSSSARDGQLRLRSGADSERPFSRSGIAPFFPSPVL